MKEMKNLNLLSIMSQMFVMALAVVLGGGIGAAAAVEVADTPEAEVVTPAEATDSAEGGKMGFPEQSVTTGEQGAPEMYEPQYDKLLTKIRPVRTPIDQISRRAGASKNVKAMEFKFGAIDYQPISTTLDGQYTYAAASEANEPVEITVKNANVFNRRDVIIVKNGGDKCHGYTSSNEDSGEDLKLWVKDRNGKKLTVIAINGTNEGTYASAVPTITTGATLIRIAKACAELDSQAPGYAIFPTTGEQYCQKFMSQVEQSTIDALTAKRFDITLNDQEEATLADMRLGMEGAFLFGTKAKFLDPDTQRYVWTTQGIWNQVSANLPYTKNSNYWTMSTIIDLAKSVFTGPGAGKSDKRLVVCGSDLLAELEKAFVGNYTFVHKINKWDLTFTEVQTNFGSFMFILDEVFDLHGQPGDGLILDVEYLERFTFEAFHANTIDLDAQGSRDSKARVLREISAMVLKSPKNHMKLIAKA